MDKQTDGLTDRRTNAEVTYSLVENPYGRFRIDADTGTIFLNKSLSDVGINYRDTVFLSVF
jgi:hypothetical protein